MGITPIAIKLSDLRCVVEFMAMPTPCGTLDNGLTCSEN